MKPKPFIGQWVAVRVPSLASFSATSTRICRQDGMLRTCPVENLIALGGFWPVPAATFDSEIQLPGLFCPVSCATVVVECWRGRTPTNSGALASTGCPDARLGRQSRRSFRAASCVGVSDNEISSTRRSPEKTDTLSRIHLLPSVKPAYLTCCTSA